MQLVSGQPRRDLGNRSTGAMRTQTKRQTLADRDHPRRSVNVLVSGFAHQSLVSVDDISASINALPSYHLAGLDKIIYDPHWKTPAAIELRYGRYPPKGKAVFVRNERTILVFSIDNPTEFQHILYHEIGHHVFDRVLASAVRKQWVTVINPHSRHITGYAARNALEDFAECYATFVVDPKKLEELYRKYVFLRDNVFAGVAYNLSKGHIDIGC
jgi:hypothetical protein